MMFNPTAGPITDTIFISEGSQVSKNNLNLKTILT